MKQRLGIATMFAALLSLDVAAGQVGEWWVGLFALPMFAIACTVISSSLPKWRRHPLVLFAAVFIPIVTLAAFDHCWSEGKPFSVLEGVSNWPTILLRVTAAAYCVFALIRGDQADKESMRKLTKRYQLFWKTLPSDVAPAVDAVSCRTLVEKRLPPGVRRAGGRLCRALAWAWMNPVTTLAEGRKEKNEPPCSWKSIFSRVKIWFTKDHKENNNGKNKIDPIRLWVRYRQFSRVDRVIGRVARLQSAVFHVLLWH